MGKVCLDLRYPDAYLRDTKAEYSDDEMRQATELGQDYRSLKMILKRDIESKRKLAREFRKLAENPEDRTAHIERVKFANEKIKATKRQLEQLRHSIRALVISNENDDSNSPPQFAINKNLDVSSHSIIDIAELDASKEADWCDYVNNHSNATIYHSLNIKKVIENTFRHTTLYLVATNETGSVCGILPMVHLRSWIFGNYWCSVPFFNYGGVLADNDLARSKLIDFAQSKILATGSRYIEFRQTHEIPDMPVRNTKVSMILPLPNHKDKLWGDLGANLRSQIKKAKAQGHHVRIGKEELIDDFYRVFSRNMRDLGTPVYSKSLFGNMLSEVPHSNIIILYLGKKAVSAGFLVGWKNTVEIPWASTLREANKYNSNMLLYWYSLQFAIDNKYDFFDFGRSTENSSTHKFKRQWGANQYQLYWYYGKLESEALPDLSTNSPKFKLAISLWRHLPLWFTNLVGPHIVRFIS